MKGASPPSSKNVRHVGGVKSVRSHLASVAIIVVRVSTRLLPVRILASLVRPTASGRQRERQTFACAIDARRIRRPLAELDKPATRPVGATQRSIQSQQWVNMLTKRFSVDRAPWGRSAAVARSAPCKILVFGAQMVATSRVIGTLRRTDTLCWPRAQ